MQNKNKIIKKIKMHKNAIAKHRDALRELISEVHDIIENSDEAVVDLETCC